MNPYALLALVLFWLASITTAGWLGSDYQKGKQAQEKLLIEKAIKAQADKDQKWADDLGGKLESRFDKLRVVNTTVNNEVRHEREVHTQVLNNPDCTVPDSTVGVLNRARGHAPEKGEGAGKPPATVPSDGKAAVAGSAR